MSTQFENVIQRTSTLPVEIQNEIAEQWLKDGEKRWQRVSIKSELTPEFLERFRNLPDQVRQTANQVGYVPYLFAHTRIR